MPSSCAPIVLSRIGCKYPPSVVSDFFLCCCTSSCVPNVGCQQIDSRSSSWVISFIDHQYIHLHYCNSDRLLKCYHISDRESMVMSFTKWFDPGYLKVLISLLKFTAVFFFSSGWSTFVLRTVDRLSQWIVVRTITTKPVTIRNSSSYTTFRTIQCWIEPADSIFSEWSGLGKRSGWFSAYQIGRPRGCAWSLL